jgi:rare lipoprotein A
VSVWMRFLLCIPWLIWVDSARAEPNATGLASFYAGIPRSSEKLTAAHRSLPFGTMVSVTRLDTGAQVVVQINDRGPFLPGRIIDLSRHAAEALGIISRGLARVRVQVIPAPARAVKMSDPRSTLSCEPCGLPVLVE